MPIHTDRPDDRAHSEAASADPQVQAAREYLRRHRERLKLDIGALPQMPQRVVVRDDQVEVAVPNPQDESMEYKHYVRAILEDYYEALTDPNFAEELDQRASRSAGLALLRAGLPTNVTKIKLPHNSAQVEPAAEAVLRAVATEQEASSMQMDAQGLSQDLRRAQLIEALSRPFALLSVVCEAHRAQVLNRISERVRNGITRGESVILANVGLQMKMEPALDLVGGPAAEAVRRRRENERRAKEDSGKPTGEGPGAETAPAGTIVTVTTPGETGRKPPR